MTLICNKSYRNSPLASQACRQLFPTESASFQHRQASSTEELRSMLSSSILVSGVPGEYRSLAQWSIVSCLIQSWRDSLENQLLDGFISIHEHKSTYVLGTKHTPVRTTDRKFVLVGFAAPRCSRKCGEETRALVCPYYKPVLLERCCVFGQPPFRTELTSIRTPYRSVQLHCSGCYIP